MAKRDVWFYVLLVMIIAQQSFIILWGMMQAGHHYQPFDSIVWGIDGPPFLKQDEQKNLSYICPQTADLFQNVSKVIEKAEEFHNGGGSLKSIQQYLDRQIDKTYRALKVEFQDESGNPIGVKSHSDYIHQELKRNDVHHRGGYDQRKLPIKIKNGRSPHMSGDGRLTDVMESFSFERWEAAMGPMGPTCKSLGRIQHGKKKSYQDKFMCSYDDLKRIKIKDPLENSVAADRCDMISIGSNDQWGFEEAVRRDTNCRTHTFDCTLGSGPNRKPESQEVKFYNACLSAENLDLGGRSYITYENLWRMTGMTDAPRLLKMDIEGFEYDVLTSLVSNSSREILPNQISVELHFASRMYDLPWTLRTRQAGEIALLFGVMYRRGGYLAVHVDFDEGCKPCLEVLFAKVTC